MANEKIKGLGFHHISLYAADFDAAYKFYTEGLGLKLHATWGEGNGKIAMLDFGDGTILELFAGGPSNPAANARYIHLALRADDVEGAYQTALAAGAKTKSAPKVVPLASSPAKMTLQCAFVYGPMGEELEFFKVLSVENV